MARRHIFKSLLYFRKRNSRYCGKHFSQLAQIRQSFIVYFELTVYLFRGIYFLRLVLVKYEQSVSVLHA